MNFSTDKPIKNSSILVTLQYPKYVEIIRANVNYQQRYQIISMQIRINTNSIENKDNVTRPKMNTKNTLKSLCDYVIGIKLS